MTHVKSWKSTRNPYKFVSFASVLKTKVSGKQSRCHTPYSGFNSVDWLSPASKSRYGWNTAKATYILNTTNQPTIEHPSVLFCLWHIMYSIIQIWIEHSCTLDSWIVLGNAIRNWWSASSALFTNMAHHDFYVADAVYMGAKNPNVSQNLLY